MVPSKQRHAADRCVRLRHSALYMHFSCRSAINYVSIHPSGRLAVTVGRDRALHLWDITKGKHAYKTKLPQDGQQVHFNKDGSRYVVLFEHSVVVYEARTGTPVATMDVDKTRKLCDCCVFVHRTPGVGKAKKAAPSSEQEFVLIGSEGGELLLWDMGEKKVAFATGHARRVRCVAYCPSIASGRSIGASLHTGAPEGINPLSRLADATKKPVSIPTDGPFIVSADSEGIVKIWQFEDVLNSAAAPVQPLAVITAASGSRVTCMAVSGVEVTAAGVAIPEKSIDEVGEVAPIRQASGHKRKREIKAAPASAAHSEGAEEAPLVKSASKKSVKFRA
jgi:protein MAK11